LNFTYYLSIVDFSYNMLRVAVNTLDESNLDNDMFKDNMNIFAINGDIRNLHLYRDILEINKGCRLFSFLGGTLGNFYERDILEPIIKIQ